MSLQYPISQIQDLFDRPLIEVVKNQSKGPISELSSQLDSYTEKTGQQKEALLYAIARCDKNVVKEIMEKFKLQNQIPNKIKVDKFYNILFENENKDENKDIKENISDLEIPLPILIAIGGSIETFKYLKEKTSIKDLNEKGYIGFSKKQKNAFTSNMVGACCYYGNYDLLKYILESAKNTFKINLLSTEKKVKTSKLKYIREYANCTPVFLALHSDSSDERTLQILKLLDKYGGDFTSNDSNKENILHTAVRNNKISCLKFLIEEKKLSNFLSDSNSEGYTPSFLADFLKFKNLKDYLQKAENEMEKDKPISQVLEDILKDDKKKKNKGKKGKKNDFHFLNSTDYQETLKTDVTVEKGINREKLQKLFSDNPKTTPKEEANIKSDEDNIETKNEEELDSTYKAKQRPKTKNYNNKANYYSRYKQPSKAKAVEVGVDIKSEPIEEKNNTIEHKDKKENKEKKQEEEEPQQELGIIGLDPKKYRKKNKKAEEEDKKTKKNIVKKTEENAKIYENKTEEISKPEKNKEQSQIKSEQVLEQFEKMSNDKVQKEDKEEPEKTSEKEEKSEPINQNAKTEEPIIDTKTEEIKTDEMQIEEFKERKSDKKQQRNQRYSDRYNRYKPKAKFIEVEISSTPKKNENIVLNSPKKMEDKSEQDDDSDEGEEDFLGLNENIQKTPEKIEKKAEEKIPDNSILNSIKKENIEDTNEEKKQIDNSQDIEDLLYLANEELSEKCKIINELTEKLSICDLTNIKNFSEEKLKKIKLFYTENLKKINDALRVYGDTA